MMRAFKHSGEIVSILAVDKAHYLSRWYCHPSSRSDPLIFWALGHYSFFIIGREGDLEEEYIYGSKKSKIDMLRNSYWSLFWEAAIDTEVGDLKNCFVRGRVVPKLKSIFSSQGSTDKVLLWIRLRYDHHFPSPQGEGVLSTILRSLPGGGNSVACCCLLRSSSWPNVSLLLVVPWNQLKFIFKTIIQNFGEHLVRSDTYIMFPEGFVRDGLRRGDANTVSNDPLSFSTNVFLLGKNYREIVLTEGESFEIDFNCDGLKCGGSPKSTKEEITFPVSVREEQRGVAIRIGDTVLFRLQPIFMIKDSSGEGESLCLKEDSRGNGAENRDKCVFRFCRRNSNRCNCGSSETRRYLHLNLQKSPILRVAGYRVRDKQRVGEVFQFSVDARCMLDQSLSAKDSYRIRDQEEHNPIEAYVGSLIALGKEKEESCLEIDLLSGVADVQLRYKVKTPEELRYMLKKIQQLADRHGLLIKTLTSLNTKADKPCHPKP